MKHKITLLLMLFVIAFNGITYGQDGTNDSTFNPTDLGYYNGVNSGIASVVTQPDGKIIIGGGFIQYKGVQVMGIARINADETLDTTFDTSNGANGSVEFMLLQPDGKILIGGDFTEYAGQSRNHIARINSDGSLDETFNPGEGADDEVYSIALQDDSKILVGGNFENFNGQPASHLIRLNADGTIDNSFAVSGVNSYIRALALQADGKILVAGAFTQFNNNTKNMIVRLNADGTNDNSFSTGIGPSAPIYAIAINNEGKIFIGGYFYQFNGQSKNCFVGLNENGSINTAFDVGIGYESGFVTSICVQDDGKVLVGGGSGNYNGIQGKTLIRINTDGTADNTFDPGSSNEIIRNIKVALDGKIIVAGFFSVYNNYPENKITVLNVDGSRDNQFDIGEGTGADSDVLTSDIQPDDKIIIGGIFYNYNGVLKNRIARLTADGELDNAFITGTGFNSDVLMVLLQPDGKILVSGEFSEYDGQTVEKMVRLNSDGTLDTSFNLDVPFLLEYAHIEKAVLQPDGKILIVAGFVTSLDGLGVSKSMIRINSDGSYDSSFDYQGADRWVVKMILLPDDKFLVIFGNRFSVPGDTVFIQRLNSNGSLDNSFTSLPVSYMNSCSDAVRQSDGKIVLSGSMYNITDLSTTSKIIRLNDDGTLDENFNEISIDENLVSPKLWLQSDDKIIVTNVDKLLEVTGNIIRLTSDGLLDTTFDSGTGVNGTIYSLKFQSNAKIIIAGTFNSYDESGRNRIARINSSGLLGDDTFVKTDNILVIYKVNNSLVIGSTKDMTSVEVYDLSGRLIAQKKNIRDITTSLDEIVTSNTILIVNVKHTDGTKTRKKIYF